MRIAIIGTRGIPANYGGFETFAEELSTRLVIKGHEVTVYGRSNVIKYPHRFYHGVRLIILPTIAHKYFDTVFNTFLATIHSLFMKFDVILLCNAANSLFSFIPRLTGMEVCLNVDGIERKRAKWNVFGKLWYRIGEVLATLFPSVVVTDSKVIQDYYRTTYQKESIFIPYGAPVNKVYSAETLKKLGIERRNYFLYVSRLEPENNAHLVISAFEQLQTHMPLVIVGDAPYSKKYIEDLKKTKDSRIIFAGYVFGQGYKELQSHAYCYIHGTSVGGTHPALIEAMGYGNCVIVNGTLENLEVVQDCAIAFRENDADDLLEKLKLVASGGVDLDLYRLKAMQRIKEHYSWEAVVDAYEHLFYALLGGKTHPTAS
jgi:glycosyltransferase involved in cell wall biosynthesis